MNAGSNVRELDVHHERPKTRNPPGFWALAIVAPIDSRPSVQLDFEPLDSAVLTTSGMHLDDRGVDLGALAIAQVGVSLGALVTR